MKNTNYETQREALALEELIPVTGGQEEKSLTISDVCKMPGVAVDFAARLLSLFGKALKAAHEAQATGENAK